MKIKIGRITANFGFPFFALAAYFLSGEMCMNYLYAVVFSSLHELGHLISLKIYGVKINSLSFDISGIKIEKSSVALSYESECIVALSGPLINLILALFFCALKTKNSNLILPFNINIGLFIINMLPVGTLDGGRCLSCFLLKYFDENKAEKIRSVIEVVVAVLLVFVLVVTLIFDFFNTSFIFFTLSLVMVIVINLIKS